MTPRRLLVALPGLVVLGWLLAPLAVAARVSLSGDSLLTYSTGDWSLRWYAAFLADRRWTAAAGRGLLVAALSAGAAVLTGTPLALAVARHRFAGRAALAGLAIVPLGTPPAALGVGLLPVFHLLHLWGSVAGLVLAHALLGLPVVYLVVTAHLRQTGIELEAAARGLGATPRQAVRLVTLPLVRPAILAGAAAAAVGSLNESVVTLFLAAPDTETLPAVVWPQLRYAASPLVAVACCLNAVAAVLVALLLARFVPEGP